MDCTPNIPAALWKPWNDEEKVNLLRQLGFLPGLVDCHKKSSETGNCDICTKPFSDPPTEKYRMCNNKRRVLITKEEEPLMAIVFQPQELHRLRNHFRLTLSGIGIWKKTHTYAFSPRAQGTSAILSGRNSIDENT